MSVFGRKKRAQQQDAADEQPAQAGAADESRDGQGGEPGGSASAAAPNGPTEAADGTDAGGAEAPGADESGSDGPAVAQDRSDGPFDESEVEDLDRLAAESRVLDLGSVLIPVPEGGQVQVEMGPNGSVNGVFITIGEGRITMAGFAGPKSPGQWRSVITELAESVRRDGATASVRSGRWGRELLAESANGDVRFIGVDGPRWMLRGVAIGPSGKVADDAELTGIAREMISGAVVRRGSEPMPVRSPLTVTLPEALAQQLAQARQQQSTQSQADQQRAALQQLQQRQQQMSAALRQAGDRKQEAAGAPEPPVERQNPDGSAMQQFRRDSAD